MINEKIYQIYFYEFLKLRNHLLLYYIGCSRMCSRRVPVLKVGVQWLTRDRRKSVREASGKRS